MEDLLFNLTKNSSAQTVTTEMRKRDRSTVEKRKTKIPRRKTIIESSDEEEGEENEAAGKEDDEEDDEEDEESPQMPGDETSNQGGNDSTGPHETSHSSGQQVLSRNASMNPKPTDYYDKNGISKILLE